MSTGIRITLQGPVCSVCGTHTYSDTKVGRFYCPNTSSGMRDVHEGMGLRRGGMPGGMAGPDMWFTEEDLLAFKNNRESLISPLRSPTVEPKETQTPSVETTLNERGARYGKFEHFAVTAQDLKIVLHRNSGHLKPHHVESIEMILHKITRILNGDPDYIDNWHDIAGYATLVEKILKGEGV